MKEELLKWNINFYGILYSASMLYTGYEYGEASHYPISRGPEYFIYPAVYLIFFFVARRLLREREYVKGKSYFAIGFVTLACVCLDWGSRLYFYNQGRMTLANHLDIYVYPAVLAFFSVLISVCYFICAAKTWKEDKESNK